MRLFVALWPTAEAVEHLRLALEPVREASTELRWQPPERWHLTLAFIGEVPDDSVAGAIAALTRAADRPPPEPVRLAGAGAFSQLLWIGLDPEPSPLVPLVRSINRELRHARFKLERRPWSAHLTVARRRGATAQLAVARDALAGYEGPFWDVSEVTLVRSTTGPEPSYSVVARAPIT